MPIDIGKKQTIEEITNGRIKKTPRTETERQRPAGRAGGGTRAAATGRTTRSRRA